MIREGNVPNNCVCLIINSCTDCGVFYHKPYPNRGGNPKSVLSQVHGSPKCRVLDGVNVVFLINGVVFTPVLWYNELQIIGCLL